MNPRSRSRSHGRSQSPPDYLSDHREIPPYFMSWKRHQSSGLGTPSIQTAFTPSPAQRTTPVSPISPSQLPMPPSHEGGHSPARKNGTRKDPRAEIDSILDLMLNNARRQCQQDEHQLERQRQDVAYAEASLRELNASGSTKEAMDRPKSSTVNRLQPDPSIWNRRMAAARPPSEQSVPSQIPAIEQLVNEINHAGDFPGNYEHLWASSGYTSPDLLRRVNMSSDSTPSLPYDTHQYSRSNTSYGSHPSLASHTGRLQSPASPPLFNEDVFPMMYPSYPSSIPKMPYPGGLNVAQGGENGQRRAVGQKHRDHLSWLPPDSPLRLPHHHLRGDHEIPLPPSVLGYSQSSVPKAPTAPRAFHPPQPKPSQSTQLNNPPRAVPGQFRPMQAVLEPDLREHLIQKEAMSRSPEDDEADGKFSSRYYGMHTEGNASADHLSDEQNCALWLRNLPPDVTYKELLDSIRGVGRIWCTYINTPDFIAHNTAAAKVVFFTANAARLLLSHIETHLPTIRGFRIKADYNRIKYGERALAGNPSRVLIITGDAFFVNPASLNSFFTDKFVFQTDEIIELIKLDGRAVVEFRFGSYRCQAQMGKMALDRVRPEGLEMVEFGEDPCETGNSFISYRTATERIQGIGISTSL